MHLMRSGRIPSINKQIEADHIDCLWLRLPGGGLHRFLRNRDRPPALTLRPAVISSPMRGRLNLGRGRYIFGRARVVLPFGVMLY
jgi:hypothetical protein